MSEQAVQPAGQGFWDTTVDPVLDFIDPGLTLAGAADTAFGAATEMIPFMKVLGEEYADAMPVAGAVLDGIGFASGVGKMGDAFSDDGKGLHDDGLYEGVGAVINNGVSLGLSGLATGVGAGLIGAGGFLGSAFGPLGTAFGAEAGAGAATVTAAGIEGVNTILGCVTSTLDVAGMGTEYLGGADAAFSADSMLGESIRGMVGDESIGWSAGSAISDALGGGTAANIAGGVIGTGINVPAALLNAADTGIGGIVNFANDVGDADSDESTAWEDFKAAHNPFAGMF